jgi:hypothetical protein
VNEPGAQTGVRTLPLADPDLGRREGTGRERERERGREGETGGISFPGEDDEGKVEDDDAVDPRGTIAQITGQRQAEASKKGSAGAVAPV